MITPTIATISREIFLTIPKVYKEGALAMGATRWEMIHLSVLKSSVSGILGAAILGLGRALGETMAVAMVIGNRAEISASLFAPAQSMASLIANEYAEASSNMHVSALTAIGFGLLIVSLIMNSIARIIVWRVERKFKGAK
jgi:phosphate transport system permease protein